MGDVITFRLSEDSGCTSEVISWLNRSERRTENIIEAIKIKIYYEKKKNDISINEIIKKEGKAKIEESNNVTKARQTVVEVKEERRSTKDDDVYPIENKATSPGVRAIRSINSLRK